MKRASSITMLLLVLGSALSVARAVPTTIYQIQMGAHAVGSEVSISNVVVTATGRFGFFVQEQTPHPTWGRMNSGIWVFTNGTHLGNVVRGDVVNVTGFYDEYFNFSEIDVYHSPCGQSVYCAYNVVTTAPVPDPVVVHAADVNTAGPFAEAYESVLIKVVDDDPAHPKLFAGPPDQFDEWFVCEDGVGLGDCLLVDSYSADPFGDFDYEIPPEGTQLDYVAGILVFNYGNFKIAPRSCPDDLGMPCRPNLRGVWAYDSQRIDVLFAVPVDLTSSQQAIHYDFDSGLPVLSAQRDAQDHRLVHLTTGPQTPGAVDIAYVSGVLSEGAQTMMEDGEYTFAQGLTPIYNLQYVDDLLQDDSDYRDIVVTTTGRVTQVAGNYYFVQEGAAGPFQHLYIRVAQDGTFGVGDSVRVAGAIREYYGATYLSFQPGIVLCENLGDATRPVIVTNVTADQIIYNADNEGPGLQVGPNDNAPEPWEDALLRLNEPAYLDSVDGAAGLYGEWWLLVSPDSAAVDLINEANAGGQYVRYRPTVGDTAIVAGILRYEFGEYHLVPRTDADIELLWNNAIGTAVGEQPAAPARARMAQNQPNPFGAATRIAFRLEADARAVDVEVFDVAGALVRTLLRGAPLPAGPCVATWDGRSDQGAPVAAGTYFYRVTVDGRSESKQMVVLR